MTRLTSLLAIVTLLSMGSTAWAQLVTFSPELPPDGDYLSPDDVHIMYTGADLEIVLQSAIHRPIVDRAQREDVGGDELETFDSTLTGLISARIFDLPGVGEVVIAAQPVVLGGLVQVLTTGKTGNTTGTFQTEIVSMSLTGIVATPELFVIGGPAQIPITINESPSQASLGRTTIVDIGGGLFQIDSFFDVFTEVVVPDITAPGEFITIPSAGSAHMVLVPEPGSMCLLGLGMLGLLGLLGFTRRRRR